MQSRDRTHLSDIVEAARLLQTFVEKSDRESFEQDPMRQSAVMRQLEVIGEATKRLSQSFRDAHPEIPWRKMAGMRDILIHAYDDVDPEEVWNAAVTSVPSIVRQIMDLMPPPESGQPPPGESNVPEVALHPELGKEGSR